MSFSYKAAAAFRELHHRLKSLEDTIEGSVESGTRGVMTRLPSSNSVSSPVELGVRDAKHDAEILLGRRGCSDIPIFGGEYEENEDWQCKVRTFLNSECSLLPNA